jgi:putative transposase
MPRSRYRVLQRQYPYFMTATINNWLPVFTKPETVSVVYGCWRFLQQTSDFEIFGYVIMENHLHLVARSHNIEKDMKRFKSYTAREIVACLQHIGADHMLQMLALFKRSHKVESDHQVWEEGSHPQIIESESVLKQKLDYIHQNPVKRGYVDLPEHWRYSSARNYVGMEGVIDVCMEW